MIIQNQTNDKKIFKSDMWNSIKNNRLKWILEMESKLRNLESEFDKTISRNNWYVVGTKPRRIFTPNGDIVITRKIYKNRHTFKYKILFDKHIGIEPRNYVLNANLWYVLKDIPKIYSYKKLVEIFGMQFSSIQISRMLKRYEMYIVIKKLGDFETVFVNLDGFFVNQWRSKRYEMKFASCFTGVTNEKRGKLINRQILPFEWGITAEKLAIKLEQYIKFIYGDVKNVIIVGDGARWISQVPKYFSEITAVRYIDQFHFKKWVKDLVGRKEKIDWNAIQKLTKHELKNYLLNLIANDDGEIWNYDGNIKIIRKIVKFRDSYNECKKNKYINTIEAMQSHYVAPILKYKRAFSKANGYKVLMFNLINVNNWEIAQNKNQGIKIEEYYDGNVKIDLSGLRDNGISNVPLLDSTNSGMVKMLNSIIHCS